MSAIKIGAYYLTKNNPRELLRLLAEKQDKIDKAIEKLEEGITFCKNDSQGVHDKCNIAIKREQNILDILKEVE